MSAKTQSTLKAVLLALFIALTVVTWILSLVPGNVSAEQSDAVGNFVAGILPYYTFEPVQSLVINHPQQLYNVGDTVQLQLSFYPNNASYPLVIWQSLDTNVALISYNGEITFIGEGSAKFVATYAFDDSIYTDITLTCSSQMLCPIGDKRGDSIKILTKPTVPINYWTQLSALSTTTSESVFPVWSVEDESIAAIIDNNYIVGKTAGQTTLIAQYGDIEERIIVDIYYDNSIGFAEGIELGAITDKLQVYHELQLDAILVADNTSSVLDYIIWESDNPAIATVDKGIVYGKSPGTTKIYAKWYLDDNIKNYFEVTVTDILPQGISVIAPTILSKNEYELIHVQFDNNPFDKRVSFFPDNEKVVTVNKNGLLAAKKNGSATITVTSLADESVYTTINLTVKAPSIFLLQVRKIIGHFGLFFVLAILGTLSLFMLIKDKKFGMLINLFCGILTASVAEILQLPIFVAGRFASFADVIINFSGYLVGSIFTLLSMHMIAKIKASRKTIQPPTKQN